MHSENLLRKNTSLDPNYLSKEKRKVVKDKKNWEEGTQYRIGGHFSSIKK